MSANYPPPQPPAGQNPYAQQPQSPYGPPPQGAPAAYGAPPQGAPVDGAAPQGAFGPPQQPAAPGGFAYPVSAQVQAPDRGNPTVGVLAAVGAVIVGALLYGLLIKGTNHEIGYAALGVGALVGLALGKIGGRNPVLPFLGIPLALAGVYLGQLYGIALIASGEGVGSVGDIFFHQFSTLQHVWKDSMDAKDFLFFALAGLEGFVITKRVAN
jgi:hypothetical protein